MRQGHKPTIRDAKSHAFMHRKVYDEISHMQFGVLSHSHVGWFLTPARVGTGPVARADSAPSATSSATTRTSPASWMRWASTSRSWANPTPDGPHRHPYPPAVLPPQPELGSPHDRQAAPCTPELLQSRSPNPNSGAHTTAKSRPPLPSCPSPARPTRTREPTRPPNRALPSRVAACDGRTPIGATVRPRRPGDQPRRRGAPDLL